MHTIRRDKVTRQRVIIIACRHDAQAMKLDMRSDCRVYRSGKMDFFKHCRSLEKFYLQFLETTLACYRSRR